ncbi:threonine/serine ThrE exporter family protein [Corynebacterium kozikiae]|uniref:threonine/serine ThrE exporter family protein n=1 Tax=Corynebacterium kozikiae TaxID=2968469 RepID=UPI002796356F|nr:threonine/serine exporter family protein [Corynebacterium sp. 76QC2CO]
MRLLNLTRRTPRELPAATIDVARAAPLAPLAPVVDLADRGQITGVLEIAARIGEILVSAGSTSSDATAQVKAVTEAFGLWYVHVDMTHNLIRLFAQSGEYTPVVVVRVIRPALQNFHTLTVVDQLIHDILTGAANPAAAAARLDALDNSREPFGIWPVALAWGAMGGSVALLIGGSLVAAALALVAGVIIVLGSDRLSALGLPLFFQNVYGGVVASLLAAGAFYVGQVYGVALRPSMVVAACIVAMLAGLTLVQALQNLITSAPISGTARLFDALLATSGIVAGVGIGITLSTALGFPLPPLETSAAPNFASTWVRVLGSVGATMAFARACFANWTSVAVSGLTAAFGSSLFYYVLVPYNVPGVTANALTAVLIGLIGGLLARRYSIPPLIISIAGVTPLLSGLAVYRGMYGLLHEQVLVGFSNLTYALVATTALSAGVVFGEWLARRVRMPQNVISAGQFVRRRAAARGGRSAGAGGAV